MSIRCTHNLDRLLLAFSITFPVYILTFVGMQPITQGFAYLPYSIIFFYFCYRTRNLFFSKSFILFWVIFLVAWMTPSIINAYSGRLESDLVRLPVLFVHVAYMTMLLFSFGMFLSLKNNQSIKTLLLYISIMLAPLLITLLLKTFLMEYDHPELRPSPFGASPHFVGEVLLVFFFGVLFIKTNWVKALIIVATLLFLILLENRAGVIAVLIILGLMTLRWFFNLTFIHKKNFVILLIGIFLLIIPFYEIIFNFIDHHIFYLSSDSRGWGSGFTKRFFPWLRAYESFQAHPWLGVGFWVKPYGYELAHIFDFRSYCWESYNNPAFDIHSFWIRVLAENGLFLFSLVVGTIGYCLFKLFKLKHWMLLIIMLSILFYLSFVTRHLTLNILNASLYLIIMAVFLKTTPLRRNEF